MISLVMTAYFSNYEEIEM